MEFLGISVQTKSGKLNWQDLRRVLYVLLFTWLIGVRLLGRVLRHGLLRVVARCWREARK